MLLQATFTLGLGYFLAAFNLFLRDRFAPATWQVFPLAQHIAQALLEGQAVGIALTFRVR